MDRAIIENYNVLILALLSGLATFLGVFLGKCVKNNSQNITFGTSFAAGIMILISFFELIPESYHTIGLKAVLWVIIGTVVLWIINKILPHIHSVKGIKDCDQKCAVRLTYLITIGLILHDFPEGFAISSSFESSTNLGLLLVAATFIHNIPEGYVLTAASAKFEKNGFFYKSALFSSISTLLGATLGVVLIHWFNFINPIFLAIAAGAMLFISFHELIPISLKDNHKKVFVYGMGLALLTYFVFDLLL